MFDSERLIVLLKGSIDSGGFFLYKKDDPTCAMQQFTYGSIYYEQHDGQVATEEYVNISSAPLTIFDSNISVTTTTFSYINMEFIIYGYSTASLSTYPIYTVSTYSNQSITMSNQHVDFTKYTYTIGTGVSASYFCQSFSVSYGTTFDGGGLPIDGFDSVVNKFNSVYSTFSQTFLDNNIESLITLFGI